jgi:hypothetical protein
MYLDIRLCIYWVRETCKLPYNIEDNVADDEHGYFFKTGYLFGKLIPSELYNRHEKVSDKARVVYRTATIEGFQKIRRSNHWQENT